MHDLRQNPTPGERRSMQLRSFLVVETGQRSKDKGHELSVRLRIGIRRRVSTRFTSLLAAHVLCQMS
jgi:hypothetical protein